MGDVNWPILEADTGKPIREADDIADGIADGKADVIADVATRYGDSLASNQRLAMSWPLSLLVPFLYPDPLLRFGFSSPLTRSGYRRERA